MLSFLKFDEADENPSFHLTSATVREHADLAVVVLVPPPTGRSNVNYMLYVLHLRRGNL